MRFEGKVIVNEDAKRPHTGDWTDENIADGKRVRRKSGTASSGGEPHHFCFDFIQKKVVR